MNKYFKNFLANRPPKRRAGCFHPEDMWCGNCLNFGEEVSVTLPNGEVSKGFYRTNYK